ncbi:MAG: hypothetical protein GXX96_27535 [Planctomycetaceae bacterium]|nr:hypothetical protein [Planctomycetaceae bacterium]
MLSAPEVLNQYYLETRCQLLEVAATLDRLDLAMRRDGNEPVASDPRLERLRTTLDLLADRQATPDRAERVLRLFSD